MEQEKQNTRAFVIAYDGKIIGERYARGWTKDTPQISWSQGTTASMGPRPFERGSFISRSRLLNPYVCFNGAAPFRARKSLTRGPSNTA